jgi:hypothetical protein
MGIPSVSCGDSTTNPLNLGRCLDTMFRAIIPRSCKGAQSDARARQYQLSYERVSGIRQRSDLARRIIETMVSTSSNDIRWVYMLNDLSPEPPSIAEWASASCPDEYAVGELAGLVAGHKCHLHLFYSRRARLAPPATTDKFPESFTYEELMAQGAKPVW